MPKKHGLRVLISGFFVPADLKIKKQALEYDLIFLNHLYINKSILFW